MIGLLNFFKQMEDRTVPCRAALENFYATTTILPQIICSIDLELKLVSQELKLPLRTINKKDMHELAKLLIL